MRSAEYLANPSESALGPDLARPGNELFMVRATVLSIALAVAMGPSLPTLCKVWCTTPVADTGCRHGDDGSTTRVEKGNSCQDQVLVATMQKEESRRRTASDDVTVWAVTRSTSRAHLPDLRFLDPPRPERSDQRSAVPTPLRI